MIKISNIKQALNKNIKGIIHVGAGKCEELRTYNLNNITRIIWIEPNIRGSVDVLNQAINSRGSSAYFFVPYDSEKEPIVLSVDREGRSTVNQLGEEYDKSYAPTRKLDSFMLESGFKNEYFNFLCINAQDYEINVLKGAVKQLKYLDYVYIYDCLDEEIREFMNVSGFDISTDVNTENDRLYIKRK